MKNKFSMKFSALNWRSLLIVGFAFACALPLCAQEKSSVKLNLPDGVYEGGCAFIVKDNQFYTSPGALKKFGVAKLNEMFAGKKYKVLFAGEKIGEGTFNVIRDDKSDPRKVSTCDHIFSYDESKTFPLKTEKIIKGPLYVKNRVFRRSGGVMRAFAVPWDYKETPKKIYRTILPEEVAVVEKLVKEKLFIELGKSNEMAQYKLGKSSNVGERLLTLDKVQNRNQEMYIGIFEYSFKGLDIFVYEAAFSVQGMGVKFITGYPSRIAISGALDIDGCGEDELIVNKGESSENEYSSWIEIYKRQEDGGWSKIIRSEEIRIPL